jgi:hypothetical protein
MFAASQSTKKQLLAWYQGKNDSLKDHSLTVGQQWSAIAKAFTLNDLSLE